MKECSCRKVYCKICWPETDEAESGVIKPCPFCGEGIWEPKINQTGKYAYHVECPCGGRGATYSGPDSAIEQWNKRAI